jgi:septal ring factor EnvC (AmiA/AmiB activator)
MKLTKKYLIKLIKEEVESVAKEMANVGQAQIDYENELEDIASAFRDLHKSIYNFKPEVKNTDTIDYLKREIKKFMDKQEAQKFDELVQYAKENPPSSDDPEEMFGTVSFDDGIEPRGDE